jgi:energy-coupling factor transporter ATP-binding protein EcfA2
MAPLVDVAALTYRYPGVPDAALDSVDLRLDSGICLVAGPSGGGKSTLLRVFNGLVPHLHGGRIGGSARVDGHDVLRTPARQLATSVGFVFQDAERQAVHATVERDIAFGLENLGIGPARMRRRVGEVMERLDIAHLAPRSIASLSGGERQRVAVAGALVLRPRMLVLDEPFSQLDAGGAAALLELCVELRDAGALVVLSEHRLDDVLPLAGSLVAIDRGRVTGPAPPETLAPTLDSAPQVVRLSNAMGWSPPLLDPAAIGAHHSRGRRLRTPQVPRTAAGSPAWRLDGVVAGPGDLLRDISAGGSAGEVVAVMGRNGAGKSTLLRVVAGLVPVRAGTVWRQPGRVAYLPQNPAALLYRESVADEIAWTLRANRSGGPVDGEGDRALLAALGIDAMASRDPRDLSSGQRQRAATAAILCGCPAIALLDEPTRGMDGEARNGLVAAVRMLTARGSSVILATHDSDLAAAVADRVLVVGGGRIVDRGPPAAALSGERNEHATQLGRLFGSPGPVTVEDVVALLTPAPAAEVAR